MFNVHLAAKKRREEQARAARSKKNTAMSDEKLMHIYNKTREGLVLAARMRQSGLMNIFSDLDDNEGTARGPESRASYPIKNMSGSKGSARGEPSLLDSARQNAVANSSFISFTVPGSNRDVLVGVDDLQQQQQAGPPGTPQRRGRMISAGSMRQLQQKPQDGDASTVVTIVDGAERLRERGVYEGFGEYGVATHTFRPRDKTRELGHGYMAQTGSYKPRAVYKGGGLYDSSGTAKLRQRQRRRAIRQDRVGQKFGKRSTTRVLPVSGKAEGAVRKPAPTRAFLRSHSRTSMLSTVGAGVRAGGNVRPCRTKEFHRTRAQKLKDLELREQFKSTSRVDQPDKWLTSKGFLNRTKQNASVSIAYEPPPEVHRAGDPVKAAKKKLFPFKAVPSAAAVLVSSRAVLM